MTHVWAQTAMWLGLALIATLLSIWLKIATALSEIVVGTIAQLVIGVAAGATLLAVDDSAIKFLSGAGAIVLTFLAGAELDPGVFRRKWKEASAVGLAGTGASAPQTFRIKTQAPALTIDQPAVGSGTKDAEPLFSGAAGNGLGLPVADMVSRCVADVERFRGTGRRPDDLTLFVLRRRA